MSKIQLHQLANIAAATLLGNGYGVANYPQAITLGDNLAITGGALQVDNANAVWNANKLMGEEVAGTAPGDGEVLTYNGTTNEWYPAAPAGGGGGGLTSVGLSMPASIFDVSNSPLTANGTITVSLDNQNANLVFAGPGTGSAAAPTFRSLVAADLPNLSGTYLALGGGTMSGTIISREIRPTTTGTFNLGATTHRYQNIYGNAFDGQSLYIETSGLMSLAQINDTQLGIGDYSISAGGAAITMVDGYTNLTIHHPDGDLYLPDTPNNASSAYHLLVRNTGDGTMKYRPVADFLTDYSIGGGGGTPSLTNKYIGHGDGSNLLTGTPDMTRESEAYLKITNATSSISGAFVAGANNLFPFLPSSPLVNHFPGSYSRVFIGGLTSGDLAFIQNGYVVGGFRSDLPGWFQVEGRAMGRTGLATEDGHLDIQKSGTHPKLNTNGIYGISIATGGVDRIKVEDDGTVKVLNLAGIGTRIVTATSTGQIGATIDADAIGDNGNYTPTYTAVTNCTSVSGTSAMYSKTKGSVFFSATVTATTQVNGTSVLDITLPIASEVSGTVRLRGIALSAGAYATIQPTSSNDRAEVFWTGVASTAYTFTYMIMYDII